jgi:hypothetical protein
MTDQKVDTANPEKCPVAMLNEIQRLNVAFQECGDLEFAELTSVPDDMLREAANHLCEIRNLAGDVYERIAYEIASNELAEIASEEPEES